MSAALVRQALEFVDPDDETKSDSKRKRGGRSRGAAGQVTQKKEEPNKTKKSNKRSAVATGDSEETQEVISKLLKLSETTVDKELSEKIVKRAVAGKPVFDKIVVKKDEQKSILFPDDDPPKKKKNKKRNHF